MSFFDDEPKNSIPEENQTHLCSCQGKGLFLSTKQLSWFAALAIFLCFSILIGGYFLGQKKAYEELSLKFEQDSFADQIYYSMCSLYDSEPEESESDADSEESESEEQPAHNTVQAGPVVMPQVDQADNGEVVQVEEVVQEEVTVAQPVEEQNFYGQIAGFGTSQAAQALVKKLAKHDIKTVVNKRQSKSGRGRKVTWYQVVTAACNDKQQLSHLAERIKQIAHVKEVRIVPC